MATAEEQLKTDVSNALANEARRNESRLKIASIQGAVNAVASAAQILNSIRNDAQISLLDEQRKLSALELGAGAGITADFGPKSDITQMIEQERFAAKDAVIVHVKANPTCTEAEAAEQWHTAALASHPDFTQVIQDGLVMSALYRANLLRAKMITEDTWEAHRQWILNNEKAYIEGL